MNKLKKFLVLALSGVMVAMALTGCGSSSEKSDSDAKVEDVSTRTVYVSPQWVNAAQNGKVKGYKNVKVFEVTYTGKLKDSKSYKKGHVPGAMLIGDTDVEDAVGSQEEPYNLLKPEVIEANLLKHGITKDTKVVLYGEDPSGVARVAYGMIYDGVEDVKVLNGGLDAWKDAGYDTETDVNKAEAATDFGVAVPAHPEYWTSMTDAKAKLQSDSNFKLVSIRSKAEWLGKTSGYSYIDRAGEPEGAVWGKGADSAADVNGYMKDGKVVDLKTLQNGLWKDVDFTMDNHLAFYCGTGWRACVPFLICYQEGMDNISVYDGGWYEWQMYGDNPVQVGDPASDNCQHTTVSQLPTDKAAKN